MRRYCGCGPSFAAVLLLSAMLPSCIDTGRRTAGHHGIRV